MGIIQQRATKARRDGFYAAGRNWQDRQSQREAGLRRIESQGRGTADSPKRQKEFIQRQTAKARLSQALMERVILTQDWMSFPSSDIASGAAHPVARIVELPDQRHEAQGFATGFLVSDHLLLTNHHVFPGINDCLNCGAHFMYFEDERGTNKGIFFELDPQMFFLSDEAFDFALVAVKAKGLGGEMLTDCGRVRLIEATGKILTGDPVNIIEHPDGGIRKYATTNNRLVDILDSGYLHYETDTAKGSSGSPVFNQDWELVALHHSGVPEMKNGVILRNDGKPWDSEADPDGDSIHWVANEGIRVSSLVKALRDTKLPSPQKQELLNRLLEATSDPVVEKAAIIDSLTTSGAKENGTSMAQTIFNISGNVTIHVYGDGGASQLKIIADDHKELQPGVTPTLALVQEKTLLFDPDYKKRKGYDPDFLGTRIDLPQVHQTRLEELYRVSDYKHYSQTVRNVPKIKLDGMQENDPLVLNYHHYSIVMNKQYRMCMWTASNCDYTEDMRRDERPRKEFGSESWRLDRRVPKEFQLTDSDIYEPARNFDRGHIHRREDNCWGMPGSETEFANSDTFHWTNCTPQHELFNQETPKGAEYKGKKGVWGFFEASLEKQIEQSGGQAVLFAGPLLDENEIREMDFGKGFVKYPLKFWKAIIVPESTAVNAKLLAYGYVFDQQPSIDEFGLDVHLEEEALDLPKFHRERCSLQEISTMTGVIFPNNVLAADQPM